MLEGVGAVQARVACHCGALPGAWPSGSHGACVGEAMVAHATTIMYHRSRGRAGGVRMGRRQRQEEHHVVSRADHLHVSNL